MGSLIAAAGTGGKSDCRVTYEPGGSQLSIRVSSSVGVLFGRIIEAAARRAASALGVVNGGIYVEDDGALDYVVEARTEAALRAWADRAGTALARAGAEMRAGPGGAGISWSQRDRPRRSRLYLPANQPELVPNVGLFGTDCAVLDLEDSIPVDRKAEARILARRTLESARTFFGNSEIAVRINPLSGPFGKADLEEIVGAFPQALMLPKCESASDVEELESVLGELEEKRGVPAGSILIMPIVESASGVLAAAAIAAASPRNAALCFGAEDFARDIGARRSAGGQECLGARLAVVMAASAAGIQAHDSVFSDLEDSEGFAAYCSAARAMGFDGLGLLHPSQIGAAHRAFDPSPDELDEARRVVAALEAAEAEGRGVASLDGKMIDAPVAQRARRILAMAALGAVGGAKPGGGC